MSRQKAKAKGWNTFRANMLQYAEEHPEFSLDDFMLQRIFGAYTFWREARTAERRRDYGKARGLYLKAVESFEQAEKLVEYPAATIYVEKLKTEYYDFVVHRDPSYRLNLKQVLRLIQEEPGILQTETYKLLHLPKSEITYTLYFAEKEGLIRREKKGRSYLLFFEREKAAVDTLLNLQDDDIDIREKAEQEAELKKGCLSIFSCFFWIAVFVSAGTYTGLIGAGIVVVVFIAWQIIKKIRRSANRFPETHTDRFH
jgi:DNA-binding MarR family transcriptional regulator